MTASLLDKALHFMALSNAYACAACLFGLGLAAQTRSSCPWRAHPCHLLRVTWVAMPSLMDMARIAAASAEAPAAPQAGRVRPWLGRWGRRICHKARHYQLQRHLKHRANSLRLQAIASNASGRSRTIDHLLPVAEDGHRAKPDGKGGWKKRTPVKGSLCQRKRSSSPGGARSGWSQPRARPEGQAIRLAAD